MEPERIEMGIRETEDGRIAKMRLVFQNGNGRIVVKLNPGILEYLRASSEDLLNRLKGEDFEDGYRIED